MSVIQAEVEVDETNIPNVSVGQTAKITIDAIPDRTFKGHVTEIGNSPIQATGQAATNQQATNFKVVVVLDEDVPDVRPGFTCTAEITTATRKNVVAVPIPAVAVRELIYDAKGSVVKQPRTETRAARQPATAACELEPGRPARKRTGSSSFAMARAEFVPIKIGIAGDRYFEVLSGLKAGDEVITGPYNNVRGMADGDPVKVQPPAENRREQIPRRGGNRLERDLGVEAAIADDGARQHRRRHVDHRGRVADSGAERFGAAGHPQPGRRRFLHRPAVRHRPQRRRMAARAVESPHHRADAEAVQAPQPAGLGRDARARRRGPASPIATASIDGDRSDAASRRNTSIFPTTTPNAGA